MHRFVIFFVLFAACTPIQPIINKYNAMIEKENRVFEVQKADNQKWYEQMVKDIKRYSEAMSFEMDENGKVKHAICQWKKYQEIAEGCKTHPQPVICRDSLAEVYSNLLKERYTKARGITTTIVRYGQSGDLLDLETELAVSHNEAVKLEVEREIEKTRKMRDDFLNSLTEYYNVIVMQIRSAQFDEINQVRRENAVLIQAASDAMKQAGDAMIQQNKSTTTTIHYKGDTVYCDQRGNTAYCR